MSLEVLFTCVSLCLGFSNFWPRGLRVLDFCILVNGFNQNHNKIVYLIKNVQWQSFEYVGATSQVF